jgi:hypothetical protein
LALLSLQGIEPAAAAPSDVVISEIMYHPADDAPVEFLELANRGPEAQTLSGWCLADGIDFCFPDGTTIGAGEYLVVTDDLAEFPGVYGDTIVPVGEYGGRLSNGGETVDLLDGSGAVIDSVSYDDSSPWPASPDGDGPSLELYDLAADNDLGENWLASIAEVGHSVGAVNSVDGIVFPTIENVAADPFRPDPGQPITVSASIDDAVEATLSYVINWEAEQTVAMDDGPDSVGGAGDGVWSATIPGQGAGDLVRYRVDVSSETAAAGVPDPTDTIDYLGVVVVDPSVSTNLPLLEWFMDDAVHDDILENHRLDDVTGPAVISINGEVIDNVEMRVRGNTSRADAKVNWKVEFPKGYLFDMGGLLEEPVDEFNMQQGRYVHEEFGWGTAEQAGLVSLPYFKILTHRNGQFYSVATYGGTYDGRWRDNNGRDEWALYKAEQQFGRSHPSEQALIDSGDWDKKEGDDDDWSDLHELTTVLNSTPTAEQRDWMMANLNIPQFINYAAVLSVLRHSDSGWYNYYVTRDTPDTGRWEMMLWDMDTMFRVEAEDNFGDYVTPAENGQRFLLALFNHPDLAQMYFRRVRTLIDEFLPPNGYEEVADSLVARYAEEFEQDQLAWGFDTLEQSRTKLFNGIAERRDDIAANLGPEGTYLFPPSASGQTPVVITRVANAPAEGDDAEFIELRNESPSESIDMTGWTVDGDVSGSFIPGAVLLPGASLYLVADDNGFRAANDPALFVAGSFSGSLPDDGGQIVLRSPDGSMVDTATYPLPTVSGTVTDADAAPVAGVEVDLFTQTSSGARGEFLDFTTTDTEGTFSFTVAPGCYVATFIAPEGFTFGGSPWLQSAECVEAGEGAEIDAALDPPIGATEIGGLVSDQQAAPVANVQIDLFEAGADGSRGSYLTSASTDQSGRYGFEVAPGCYILTFVAPDGSEFNGSRWLQLPLCVEAGQVIGDADATLGPVTAGNQVGGAVTTAEGRPVEGVQIDLFTQGEFGGRTGFVDFTETDQTGRYVFADLEDGCYVMTFIAPEGETIGGSQWFDLSGCIEGDIVVDDIDAVLD